MTRQWAMTSHTRRVLELARASGLRPRAEPPDRYGRILIVLNGPGRDALFGAVYVSARTGRIIRACLTWGNHAGEKRYDGAAAVARQIESWAALQRDRQRGGRRR